jgi:hypothetical protein
MSHDMEIDFLEELQPVDLGETCADYDDEAGCFDPHVRLS